MAGRSHSWHRLERVLTTLACAGVLALSTGPTAGAAHPVGGGVVAAASPFTVTLTSSAEPSTSEQPVTFTGGTTCAACFRVEAACGGDAHFEPSANNDVTGIAFVSAVGTMRASPLSGPPGSYISVSSVTGCPPLPNDPTAAERVDVALVQGTTTIASASFPVDIYGGAWQGSLTVSPTATPGEAVLSASVSPAPRPRARPTSTTSSLSR